MYGLVSHNVIVLGSISKFTGYWDWYAVLHGYWDQYAIFSYYKHNLLLK